MTLLAYMIHIIYVFTYIIITIIDKTLLYKFIIAKVSHKSLSKFLFDFITYGSVFKQNPSSILLFIVDILYLFEIDLFYLILSLHEDLI